MEKMIYFLGVDVSKLTLDIALVKDGKTVLETKISNQAVAINDFIKELKQFPGLGFDQLVVCMEYTGIYNAISLQAFHKKGIKICLEPALQIKQSQGMVRGKNDKIDALRIAQYAYRNYERLTYWNPPRIAIQKLQAILTLRERLIKTKVQLEMPLRESVGFVDDKIVKALNSSSKATLTGIDKDLKTLAKQIQHLIAEDTSISEQVKHITSVPGVGNITALNMIVATGEFKRIKESKKFACYSGVAPFAYQSGSSVRGKTRVSKMANMTMKKLFHMAAMSAIQCCEELKLYYQRKVAEGKNKMSVLNAVRNKLISRVFVCINNKRLYEKDFKNALA